MAAIIMLCLLCAVIKLAEISAAETTTTTMTHQHHSVNKNNLRHSHQLYHNKWDCNRPWPQLTLFIPFRVYDKKDSRFNELKDTFLRSLCLFWPLKVSQTSVILAFDMEHSEHSYMKSFNTSIRQEFIHKIPGGVNVIGIPPERFWMMGHDRQQYNMFWADNFTQSEYIGFGDTDTVFTTYIDREDLFENGKPVVNGRTGIIGHEGIGDGNYVFHKGVGNGTCRVLKRIEPFYAMSYFPVIVKTSHLKPMREHIMKLHNKNNFADVFREVVLAGWYSQFSIMMAYLFYYHQDEYVWYVHNQTPNWNGTQAAPCQESNMSVFTPQMMLPKPRIAAHGRYRYGAGVQAVFNNRIGLNLVLQRGVCYSPPFPRIESVCNGTDVHAYYHEMHRFEHMVWPDSHSKDALDREARKRHHRIKNCTHDWNLLEMNTIMKPQDDMKASGGWN